MVSPSTVQTVSTATIRNYWMKAFFFPNVMDADLCNESYWQGNPMKTSSLTCRSSNCLLVTICPVRDTKTRLYDLKHRIVWASRP